MTDAALALSVSEAPEASERERAWVAIWTRARAEKSVTRLLESRQVSAWLPTLTVRRRWSDRWKDVESVLFPGYLFARVSLGDWPTLLRVPGVLTVVKDGRKPARIRDSQMAELRTAIACLAAGEHQPEVVHDFEPSARVRITEGPMAGLIGVIREIRGKRRLLVGLEQIGHAVAVSIGAAHVQPCAD